MEFAVLGWPDDESTLRLDYRQFSYAGKFVTGNGIAVIRGEAPVDLDSGGVDESPALPERVDPSEFANGVLAAVAFNVDRTDAETLWLRYLTVRRDLRGSGRELGPRLAAFITNRAAEQGYKRARIAVNNAFSYHALYKTGFASTGRETGIAELILERPTAEPATRRTSTYQAGLDTFGDRTELSDVENAFIKEYSDAAPPDLVDAVDASDQAGTVDAAEENRPVDSGVSNPRRSSE